MTAPGGGVGLVVVVVTPFTVEVVVIWPLTMLTLRLRSFVLAGFAVTAPARRGGVQ